MAMRRLALKVLMDFRLDLVGSFVTIRGAMMNMAVALSLVRSIR
jgi:hypothetical protein